MEEQITVVKDYNRTDYKQFWTKFGKSVLDGKERDIVRGLLPPTPGWFVELGAGYGRLVPTYMRADRKIVLVDYALNLLQEAARKYPDETVSLIAADVYHLPFRDAAFDCGLSVRLFHHINAPLPFLCEANRILREGGHLLLSYSNKRNLLRILKTRSRAFERNQEEYAEMLFGTHPAYFDELCRNADFSVDTTRGTGFFDQIFTAIPSTERWFSRIPSSSQLLPVMEDVADFSLRWLSLLPLHFSLLFKSYTNKITPGLMSESHSLSDLLACPRCRQIHLSEQQDMYICSDCGNTYPITVDGIIDFRLGASNE